MDSSKPRQPPHYLPSWINRWFGYHGEPDPHHKPKPLSFKVCLWSFVGAFCAISLLQGLFGHAKYFVDRDVTPIVASFVRLTRALSPIVTDVQDTCRVVQPYFASALLLAPWLSLGHS